MKGRSRARRVVAVALVAASSLILASVQGSVPMTKVPRGGSPGEYESRQVAGWNVLVNKDFLISQPRLAGQTLELLRGQLDQVARAVPTAALEKLKTIRIWVEENEPHHPCMTYHPNATWLRAHGMSPEKARCVEVANARNFLSWTREQKWMVLHELSHGYHHQFVPRGFQNARLIKAYNNAIAQRLYESVPRLGGGAQRAYAATNHQEYFAELSEAYFGTNDFFPFDRSELRRHDRPGHDVVEALWGAAPAPDRATASGRTSGTP